MEQQNPIFKFFSENKLTDLDEKSFLNAYSKPEKAKEIHSFMVENKLTDLDERKFFDEYLKKKEPASSGVPNLLKPLSQSSEQSNAGFPTSPSEAMRVSTQSGFTKQPAPKPQKGMFETESLPSESQNVADNVSRRAEQKGDIVTPSVSTTSTPPGGMPPKAPKGMFEIKTLASEKPEFVDRMAKNAELQEKLLNDPNFTILTSAEGQGEKAEVKRTNANLEKNKAIAAERGQTMNEFRSDQDEYLAMFLDDRQKQEFSGIRGRLDLVKQIAKAKADGQPVEDLIKIYDEKVKDFSQAKAKLIVDADSKIKELRLALDEADLNQKHAIFEEIKTLEASKKPFFINTKKAAAEIVAQEGLEGGQSNEEKIRDYSHALLRERSDLRESLGIKGSMGIMDALRYNTISSDSPVFKRLQTVETKLRAIAPIVLLNENPITEKEGALKIFGKAALQSIVPVYESILPTNQSIASEVMSGLGLAGVDNKSITKSALSTLERTAKPYESWSAEEIAQMGGSTAGFLPKFAIATAATEGLGSLAVISPYFRAIGLLAEEGTLGAEAASPLLRIIQANKYGRGLLKAGFGGIESGIQSQVESMIFASDKDEVNFLTGFLGGSLGKSAEAALRSGGVSLSKAITALFGNKAPEVTSKMLNLAKTAYDKTKKVNSRALGEVAGETGESIAQMWQQSDTGEEFLSKIKEQYGDPSNALKFFLSTYMMGFGLSSGTYLGKWSNKKSADTYKNLSPKDKAIADNIISEMRQEQNAADTDAAVDVIKGSNLPDDKKAKLEDEARTHGEVINNVIEGNADTSTLKPFEAKDLSDSPEKQKEQADIDKRVVAFQERTGYKPEKLNFDGQTEATLSRLESGAPVDTVAVEEASNMLYKKYKQYENMLNSTSRLMTTEQIGGLMSELEEKITRLENVKNGKDFNTEIEPKTSTVEQTNEPAPAQEVSTEPQAVKSYADSVSSRDIEQGFGDDTVEGIIDGQYYKDIIASAKAEGIPASKVLKDMAKSRALDNLESREDLDNIENQIKADLATEATPAVTPTKPAEVEPIDEFVEANYIQIMADLKLKNRVQTSGCGY